MNEDEDIELGAEDEGEEPGQEQGDKKPPEPSLEDRVAAGVTTAVEKLLAQGQQQQQPQRKAEEDEDDTSYDPRQIRNSATADAIAVFDAVDDMLEDIRETYPDMPAAQMREIKNALRQQPLKNLKVVQGTKQHIVLADAAIGKLTREGKYKPGQNRTRSDRPLDATTPGAGQNPRSGNNEARVVADYESKFGRKPSKAALKELMAED